MMEDFLYFIFLISYMIIKCYWAQLVALGVIIVFMIFLIKNIKRKRKKQITIFSSLIITTVLLIVSFYIIFPHNFPYVDMWIYGKTSEEIQAVYGEPKYDGHGMICYRTEWRFLDYNYYCIEFRDGKAFKIYESLTPWPGG